MKKLFVTRLMGLLALLVSLPINAEGFEYGGIHYYISTIYDNEAWVCEENDIKGEIVIPEYVTYNGETYRVTGIMNSAFAGCRGLTSVTIPNSVSFIDEDAFYGCSSLTSISIPNSLTNIGPNAFSGTAWYDNHPDGLVYAGNVAYKYKGEMPANTDITLRDGTIVIGDGAFGGCNGLTSISIPNSVISIGYGAFSGCSSLNSITIPNSVISIGSRAFYKTAWYDNQPNGLVYAGKVLYKYKGEMPTNTNITLRDGTIGITDHAFEDCSGLTSITIPNSVTSIGYGAFDGCTGLTSITIPNSVTSIGSYAFSGCTSLTSITIPNSVSYIDKYTFYKCTGLTSINISNSVKSIREWAFHSCSGLTSITIPNSVTSIDNCAFAYCNGLTSVISEIENPFAIYDNPFYSDDKDIYATATLTVPAGTKALYQATAGWNQFKNIVEAGGGSSSEDVRRFESGGITYNVNDNGTTVTVTAGNTKYKGDISIPSSVSYNGKNYDVTSIGYAAFGDCTGLTSISIPNSVGYIQYGAFQNCSGLSSITLPKSIKSIAQYAFIGCSSLTKIISEIESPFSLEGSTFDNSTFNNATLTVPAGTKSLYQSTGGWKNFKNIVEAGSSDVQTKRTIHVATAGTLSSYISESEKFQITDLTLTGEINGTDLRLLREMAGRYAYSESDHGLRVSSFHETDGKLTILDLSGVKIVAGGEWYMEVLGMDDVWVCYLTNDDQIPSYIFLGCSVLTSISLPNSVTSISNYAFESCTSLTSITIPYSVTSIGSGAFSETAWYDNQPDGLVYAGKVAYKYKGEMPANTSITLRDGTIGIADYAFYDCTSLTSITIPNSVTSIGSNTFEGCSSLTSITIPNSVTSIGDGAFSGTAWYDNQPDGLVYAGNVAYNFKGEMPANTSITLRDGTIGIADYAFVHCRDMVYIILPNSLKSIGRYAFLDCSSLTSIVSEIEKPFAMDDDAFYSYSIDIYSTATLTVPAGTKAKYQTTDGWNLFKNIVEAAATDEVEFTLNGTTYQGTKSSKIALVKSVDASQISVEIPASVSYDGTTYQVKGMEDNAFSGCNLAALVWAPEAMLPDNAFNGATLSSNFLLYVESVSYAPPSIKNVVAHGAISSLTLSDEGAQFYCPRAFTAENISYTHNYNMETGGDGKGWETIALPFNVQTIKHRINGEIVPFASYNQNSNKKPFWLYSFSGSGFVRASSIQANTPYIIAMPNQSSYSSSYVLAGDVTFSAENVDIPATPSFSGKFVPTYSTVKKASNIYAINAVNRYVSETGGYDAGSRFISNLRDVRPFEAYITESSTRGVIEIGSGDGTTGMDEIFEISDSDKEVSIYSLNGQKVMQTKQRDLDATMNQLPNGVYLVNGKKIVK